MRMRLNSVVRGCAALAAALVLAGAPSGCAWIEAAWEGLGEREEAAPEPVRQAGVAELRLSDAALRAERALTTLQRIRASVNGEPAAAVPRIVAPELLVPVTLEWIGPIGTLLESLAEKAGYRFVAGGRTPPAPLVVSVSAEEEALIFVLRDVGLQAGAGALVVVDAARGEVRLDWRTGLETS